MKIAIVGSRKYVHLSRVAAFVESLEPATVVVSGGAKGVDSWAVYCARLRQLETVVYPPEYDLFGDRAPLIRNRKIVEQCDKLYAFWDGKSRGTAYTMKLAKKAGKLAGVFYDD